MLIPIKKKKDFYNALNKIHDICQDHLAEYCGDNEASSFGEKLYYKQIEYQNSKGKTKSSRVLYVKLIYSDKAEKIL